MSKRGFDGDGETQDGRPSGFTPEPLGNNFGGPAIAGRKILNPKKLKSGRLGFPKPVPPQPQAQSQPVSSNTQAFGFTFGNGGSAAASGNSGGFNFGSQQNTEPQPNSGFTFGSNQQQTQTQPRWDPNQKPPQGYSFDPPNYENKPAPAFMVPPSDPVFPHRAPSGSSSGVSTGFQGSIFSVPASQPAAQSFGGFGNNQTTNPFGMPQTGANSTPSFSFGTTNNQSEQQKPSFSFGQTANTGFGATNTQAEQPKASFSFGQPASTTTNTGFGASTQSASAPSSFKFSNDNIDMTDGQQSASVSFGFGTASQQNSNSNNVTTSAAATPAFNFGTSSNSMASTETKKPTDSGKPLFSFGTPAAQPTSSASATASTPAFSFGTSSSKPAEPTKPPTTNIFNSNQSSGSPSTTTATPSIFTLSNANTDHTSLKTSAPGSIFGTPATASNATDASTDKPSTTNSDSGLKSSMFQFKPAAVPEKAAGPATPAPSLLGKSLPPEQKSLPSFDFSGAKANTSASILKPATTAPSGLHATGDGLFKVSSSNVSESSESRPSSQDTASAEAPKFVFKPTQTTTAASGTKPLISFGTSQPAPAQSASSPNPLFSQGSALSTTDTTTSAKPVPSVVFKPTTESSNDTVTSKPAFQFQPTQKKPSSDITANSSSATENSNASGQLAATPVATAPTFKPVAEARQDISPHKSPFNFRTTAQEPKVDRPSFDPTSGVTSQATRKEKSAIPSPVEKKFHIDLDKAPKGLGLPESFVTRWSTLRTEDLPMSDAVDILLHDWVLQLEIPESAFTGMNMSQRDNFTWLWQQSAIDSAWDYHVRELGNHDRNLLEVFRIVMTLKGTVDEYHQKKWTKSNSLVNSKLFDERYVRKMAKRNIEMWEDGLKSEIKNLKKRKAEVHDISAERGLTKDSGNQVTADTKQSSSAAKSNINSFKPASVETGQFNEAETSRKRTRTDKNTNSGSHTMSSSFTPSTTTKTTLFTTPAAQQNGPSKSNIFAGAKSTLAAADSSPQRSKTSQLFASIASKPVETAVESVSSIPASTSRSLFDRINRDASGAPIRETSEQPSVVAQDNQASSNDENDSDENVDDVKSHEDDNTDEDDDDEHSSASTSQPNGPNATNIFAQSASAIAKAKEAALGTTGDNTWTPDSPIRFSKESPDVSRKTGPVAAPLLGFVPSGGMPKTTSESGSTKAFSVSSQDSWQAPANPFGFFKSSKADAEKSSESTTNSTSKLEMPKPPADTTSDSGFTVSSQDTWTAPANPFGNFKTKKIKKIEESTAPPSISFTAPSPQRSVNSEPAKSIFSTGSSETAKSSETPKPLFSFAPVNKSSESTPGNSATSSIFGQPGSTAPMKSIFNSVASPTPQKPLFGAPNPNPTGASGPPPSNAWLDFAKGVTKASSPAPSGASVFASLNTSLNPSRASSPAMSTVSTAASNTDAEHNEDDEAPKEAQLDLSNANAGEESEDLEFTVRTKAYEFYSKTEGEAKTWGVRGVGELRILKNRETQKVRAVLRADQTAKVLLNAGLLSSGDYSLMSPKRVKFIVASTDGIPRQWFLQIGKEEDAKKLSDILERNKSN